MTALNVVPVNTFMLPTISKNIAKKLMRYLNILFCLIEKIGIIEYTQKKAKYGFIWIKKSEIMAPF